MQLQSPKIELKFNSTTQLALHAVPSTRFFPNWNFQFVFIVQSLPLTRLLAHSELEDNQQSMFAAHSPSINTVYYRFFKSSANREWVQGRELQHSYRSGRSPLHWTLARPCDERGSSANKDLFSGSASHW
jgi:hypothetical protein